MDWMIDMLLTFGLPSTGIATFQAATAVLPPSAGAPVGERPLVSGRGISLWQRA